jgi:hypothetical protein
MKMMVWGHWMKTKTMLLKKHVIFFIMKIVLMMTMVTVYGKVLVIANHGGLFFSYY